MRASHRTTRTNDGERGTTAATAAFALGALALGGALFGGAVLSSGYVGVDELQETVDAALHRSALGVELRGPVHLRTDGAAVTHILLDVGALPGSDGVPLDPAAAEARTLVSYSDAGTLVTDVPYAVHWLVGDGDTLLEPGELAQIDVDATALPHAIGEHDRFTVTVRPADGVPLAVERTVPPGDPLDAVLTLW